MHALVCSIVFSQIASQLPGHQGVNKRAQRWRTRYQHAVAVREQSMKIKDLRPSSVISPRNVPFLDFTNNGKIMTELVAAYARHAPLPPTYLRLKEAGKKHFATPENDLVVRNRLSSLSVFMKHFRLVDSDLVGPEFDAEFDARVFQFKEAMQLELKADRTIQDRIEHLRKWKELVFNIANDAELPEDFKEALGQAIISRRTNAKAIAQHTGIDSHTLYAWLSGERRPTRNVESQLKKLEEALRLPPETLTKRLGFVIKRRQITAAAKENKLLTTTYRQRLSTQWKREFKLNYLIEVPDSMKAEWRLILAHKISISRAHSSNNDVWRVKPRDKIGNKPSWFSLLPDGGVVPSADACWAYLSRYFSWLALDMAHGGAGYAIERINTMAWLLNEKLMDKFLSWMQLRSGNVLHGGMPSVLQYAAMFLRPETGWIWLNPQLYLSLDTKARASCLGFNPEGMDIDDLTSAWQARCRVVWEKYEKDADFLATHKSRKKARDPREPISDILAHERPLSIVMDMLATIKKNPPWCLQTKRYAVWTRDVLLLSWLSANPLRVNHFATMTYTPDNTGHVYRAPDESWHYRCKRDEFKNSPAQYMNLPDMYDVQLPKYVGDAIELYLQEGRPLLAGAYEGNFLFLPEKFANRTDYDATGEPVPIFTDRWNSEAISTRLRLITRALRDGKPGFGPHAFRHIVATDYLKRNPGAYKMVADLLCDQLQTVMKEYGHTSAQDGLNAHYQSAEAELQAAMG